VLVMGSGVLIQYTTVTDRRRERRISAIFSVISDKSRATEIRPTKRADIDDR